MDLICEVHGGKPPPRLTWYLDNNVIDEFSQYNAKTGITFNHLVYPKIGRQHLNARLICQASNTNLVTPQFKLIVLDMNRKSNLPIVYPICVLAGVIARREIAASVFSSRTHR